jgi:RNA polymerase sigma-70 factor (ECF subfamily)
MANPSEMPAFAPEAHRRYLWALAYRMTGCAADADDVVQETFTRALERTPPDARRPWRPWLVRVAVNLAHDTLRRRRRRAYVGPWLPSPVEDEALPAVEAALGAGLSTDGRYDLLESASYAFLLALEALTPRERAVLLLMDVFDYTVAEVAALLGLAAGNVKVIHHRAKKRMAGYDARRARPDDDAADRHREALMRFATAVASGDMATLEALLASDVVVTSDGGGGAGFAARVPVVGAAKVAGMYVKLARRFGAPTRAELRSFGGQPGLYLEYAATARNPGLRDVILLELDGTGRITALYSVLAPGKLTAVAPIAT